MCKIKQQNGKKEREKFEKIKNDWKALEKIF